MQTVLFFLEIYYLYFYYFVIPLPELIFINEKVIYQNGQFFFFENSHFFEHIISIRNFIYIISRWYSVYSNT